MAIRKRGDTWQIDYYDPAGKRVRKNFKQKKDAVAEHAKRKSLIAEGRYLDVKQESKITLAELCKKYETAYRNQKSFHNAKKTYLENFKEYFGKDRIIGDISRHDLVTYQIHLREKPVTVKMKNGVEVSRKNRSDAAVNREISCLHHLFMEAVAWGLAGRSPFDGGKAIKLKENNKRLRFLADDEINALLAECPAHLKPIVSCAILTGMRRAEILSLKWDQVRNGFIYLSKTKTNESRQIPVSDALEAVFREIRGKQHLTSEQVFTFRGEAIQDNTKKAFNAAVKRAGLVDFHFHDLRHTFASQVLLNGGTLKDVQELLGHKTMTMTLRYSHLTQEHKRQAVNLLGNLTAFSVVTNGHKKQSRRKRPAG
jgi:integrase